MCHPDYVSALLTLVPVGLSQLIYQHMLPSTSAAAEFREAFGLRSSGISQLLAGPASTSEIAAKLSELRALYVSHSASLPSYDQRQYDLAIKDIEKQFAVLQQHKGKPKSRFAFAKKPESTTTHVVPQATIQPPATTLPEGFTQVVASIEEHVAAATHTLSGLSNKHITPALVGCSAEEYTLSLSDISHSYIDLRSSKLGSGRLRSLHAKKLSRCVLITDQIDGSALLHDLEDCLLILGAHQFRMHTSHRCHVYLHVTSVPVIEHCSSLLFGSYPEIGSGMTGENKVTQVADFDWVRATPSPNWTMSSVSQQLSRGQLELLDEASTAGDVIDTLLPR